MTDLDYTITFFSNWHCGSGLSSGADVDALVIKDADGLPFVPGKTIKGLFKDAALTLLELKHPEVSSALIARCFGKENTNKGEAGTTDTEPGTCFFADAKISEGLRRQLPTGNNGISHTGLYSSVTNTAVDGVTGTAKNHSLRRVEVALPVPLRGFIATSESDEALEGMLLVCMKMIRRLGSGRNRGLGRCMFNVSEKGGVL